MSNALNIEEQAAKWLVRCGQPDWQDSDQKVLDAWLEQSFEHKAAYWRLEHGWHMVDRIGALGLEPVQEPVARGPWRKKWLPLALAASLVMGFVGGTIYFGMDNPSVERVQFSTAVGKTSTVPLADGSTVELNTATGVRVAVASGQREVWLDRGEAYFQVQHQADTPFIVHAGARTITVLGTKFAIRRDQDRLRVIVVEGRVRMDEASKGEQGPAALVSAGNIAFANPNSTLVVSRPLEQLRNELGWRQGSLIFDQVTLGEAAAEFNRYNTTHLLIANAATASMRIGGTFQTSNAEGFATLLSRAYGLRLKREPGKIIIRQ